MIDKKESQYFELALNHISLYGKIFDIGGFLGNWSDMALSHGSFQITIFEPNKENFEKMTSKYQNNENITIINKGASNVNQTLDYFKLIGSNCISGMSGFVSREVYKNCDVQKHQVEVIRLDNYTSDEIEFLKIDTEGFELNVIKGCEKLLQSKKVKFLQFEYGGTYLDSGISLNDILSYLDKFEYFVYDIDEHSNFKLVKDFKDNYNYNNFLSSYIKLC